jgi:hypothetical protein
VSAICRWASPSRLALSIQRSGAALECHTVRTSQSPCVTEERCLVLLGAAMPGCQFSSRNDLDAGEILLNGVRESQGEVPKGPIERCWCDCRRFAMRVSVLLGGMGGRAAGDAAELVSKDVRDPEQLDDVMPCHRRFSRLRPSEAEFFGSMKAACWPERKARFPSRESVPPVRPSDGGSAIVDIGNSGGEGRQCHGEATGSGAVCAARRS